MIDRTESTFLTLLMDARKAEEYREEISRLTGFVMEMDPTLAQVTVTYGLTIQYFGCSEKIDTLLRMLEDPELVANFDLTVLDHDRSLVFELGQKLELLRQRAEAAGAPKLEVAFKTEPVTDLGLISTIKTWWGNVVGGDSDGG